jgi:alkanesulfonate monooxygenase SsuD/methylene tetrahydromethanopterin reductase-like flavin-dependent oxidoreductase (luciferase family)
LPHDERYERADEYLDVLYQLWEGSWEAGAVLRDKAGRVCRSGESASRAAQGALFNVDGYHLASRRAAHAGAVSGRQSGRGQRFAARHAECVFISPPNRAVGRETARRCASSSCARGAVRRREGVRRRGGGAGRDRTRSAREVRGLPPVRKPRGLAHFAASTGIDYAQYDLDAPVDYTPGNAIESATRTAQQHGWTRRSLLEMFELGGRHPAIVGSASQVADELQAWVEEAGVDGFNLSRTVVPESYEDFVDLIVPSCRIAGSINRLRAGLAAPQAVRRGRYAARSSHRRGLPAQGNGDGLRPAAGELSRPEYYRQ